MEGESFVAGVPVDAFDLEELRRVEAGLHADGWASFITTEGLLRDWERLAGEVAEYSSTVDDFINDLTGRDALELVLSRVPVSLREVLIPPVLDADRRFSQSTLPDEHGVIGRFCRLEPNQGWWWRRMPPAGPLAAYLRDVPERPS